MKIELNKKKILEYQNNEPPYLMIDHASEVIPGKSAVGYKYLNKDEWFFKVHWKNDPNMPGMLQIEALSQMAALSILTLPGNKKKLMYLTSANNLKFVKKVLPEKKFYIKTNIVNYKRGIANCKGYAEVDNELACSADFNLVLPDEIKKYNLPKR
tara:strand:+ start:40 stop:504 length:465 start_codon:yes stop_codon:yes gene_type:complete